MEEQEYNRQKRALDQLKDLYGEESEEYKAAKDALGQAIHAATAGGTAGGTATPTAGGTADKTEPPLKRRKIVTDRESFADLISTIPRGQGVALPSYQFKLHDRDNQLTTIADSVVRNFRFRSRGQSPLYDTVLIPGGFCFGKSRLGFETQHISKSILEASREFGNLYPEEQCRLLEALAEPVYIYIDFGNGQQFDQALDWHNNQAVPAGVRLGVRLASRGLFGISLSSLLSTGWEMCLQLDTVLVLSQIVHEALAKRQQGANLDDRGGDKEHDPVKKPIVCIIIHLDEYQLYIERAAHLLGGDFAEGRTYFKDMVKTILEFMKTISQSQLGGEFFVIPICTGTSASDVSFLPTESNRKLVSLTPLTNNSVDEIALECYGKEFSTTNPWWKMAVGDSMGIPRFIEWMLEGKENSWSDTLSNAILTRDALRNLEYYGGPDSAERLIALALVQQPVSRKDSLGDAGTIGDIERPGTIYLVPVSSSGDMYHVGLPLPVCRVLCLELEANGRQAPIPPELLFAPTPIRPWYWQDFEKFYPYYQRLLVQSLKTLKGDQSVKVTDLFQGALGLTGVLDYEVILPPSTVFKEKDKFLIKKSDKAQPEPILCHTGRHLLEAGIFACAEGNALIDHRFACLPSSNDVLSVAFFIQTKHTMKGTSVSASFIKTWYTETMTALQAYTEQYFVVLVFVTNREFKGNAYDELFSKGCTNLLLLVNDIYAQPPSLAKFLGPTFAQRALYALDKSE